VVPVGYALWKAAPVGGKEPKEGGACKLCPVRGRCL